MEGEIRTIDTPIVLFSFSRPELLDAVCRSLKEQQLVQVPPAGVHLFQDGAVSRRSGVRYCEDSVVEANIAVFRRHFPQGSVHASPDNLGIALNILRGERFVFETLDRDVGYFFEDDLELGPYYLHAMETMSGLVRARTDVGYFAAYGDHQRVPPPGETRIIPLEHHWGFGLTRRCWRDMLPWLEPFYAIWNASDYAARPHLRIVECYASKDVASDKSSQDVAKTAACASLNYARINTERCFGKYVGKEGQSFNAQSFVQHGYDRMTFSTEPGVFPAALNDALIETIKEMRRTQFQGYRQRQFMQRLEEMRRTMFNPDTPVTREQIDWLWRLLLDRLPDQAYYDANIGVRTLREVRTALMASAEARGKSFYARELTRK